MKKFRTVIFALLAVSAFSAIVASMASAEVTLLAEWLVGGAAVTATLTTESTGGLLLEDTKTIAGEASVLCEGIFDGTVSSNGEDEIKEILSLTHVLIGTLPSGASLKCVTEKACAAATEASPIEVWPVGLPWKTLLFLAESGALLNRVFATEVGYELLCLVLGITTEDKCTSASTTVEIVNDADTGDAAIPAGATAMPDAFCTQSLENTGVNVADALTPIILTEGGLLTASSE